MKKYIYILPILFLVYGFSCSNAKNLSETPNDKTAENKVELETTIPIDKAIIVSNWNDYRDSKPVQINHASIDKNIIEIDIQYSGGCAEHTFQLIGQESIMKSFPPQRVIKLFHNPVEDDCRELIQEKLKFDISAFKYNSNEIILRLENFQGALVYH